VWGGDADKLGVLFDRHHRRLFDFLSRTIGNRTAAEDLALEIFCGAAALENAIDWL
jgi:DNA-directed RNA polymerase specialized sigma24 family protein